MMGSYPGQTGHLSGSYPQPNLSEDDRPAGLENISSPAFLQALRSRKEKNMAPIPPIIKKIAITYGR